MPDSRRTGSSGSLSDALEPLIEWTIRLCGWSAILFVFAIFAFVFREAWFAVAPREAVNVTIYDSEGASASSNLTDGAVWELDGGKFTYETRKEGSGYDGYMSFADAPPGEYTVTFAKNAFAARSVSKRFSSNRRIWPTQRWKRPPPMNQCQHQGLRLRLHQSLPPTSTLLTLGLSSSQPQRRPSSTILANAPSIGSRCFK